MNYKRILFRLRYTLKYDIRDWLAIHFPWHIPAKRPDPPEELCSCGLPYDKIIAVDTGDGYVMCWECENYCGEMDPMDWWPFWFGKWATSVDLWRVGIEIV